MKPTLLRFVAIGYLGERLLRSQVSQVLRAFVKVVQLVNHTSIRRYAKYRYSFTKKIAYVVDI